MRQYLDELKEILSTGIEKTDRTGVGTLSIFGYRMKFDLSQGEFPLLTTKKIFVRGVIEELLWMIGGNPDVKILQEKGIHIWDAWEPEPGSDKFIPYPIMWRHYPRWKGDKKGIDQLQGAIDLIKNDPGSRRIIVDSWAASFTDQMTLTPCHCMYQFYVRGEYLDMQLIVRSNDVFLGQPFNIAQYSLLLMMVSMVTGKHPGTLTYITGDTHIYLNHLDQVKLQLTREPRPLPKMEITREVTDINDFKYSDFFLSGYDPWPTIKAPVAV